MRNSFVFYKFSVNENRNKLKLFIIFSFLPSTIYYSFVEKLIINFYMDLEVSPLVSAVIFYGLMVLGVIMYLLYTCTHRGVYLFKDYMKIKGYIFFPQFKPYLVIDYKSIESVNLLNYKDLKPKEQKSIRHYNLDSVGYICVKIKVYTGNTYVFCINEFKEFTDKINELIRE